MPKDHTSLPTKIYRVGSLFPPLKALMNMVIRSMIPESINIGEGKLILNQSDVAVSGALALGMFEKQELKIFREQIRPGMTIVDIGANIGLYTLISGKRVGSSGKVFAFEPVQENFSFLQKNISANHLDNVIPLEMALAEEIGERIIYIAKDNKGHHSLSDDSGKNEGVKITTDTLDNILKRYGSPKIDLIKMDIEGAEVLALEGMRETIKNNPRIKIFTEFYPAAIRRLKRDPVEFLKSFSSMGLKICVLNENKERMDDLLVGDFSKYTESFRGESFNNLFIGY